MKISLRSSLALAAVLAAGTAHLPTYAALPYSVTLRNYFGTMTFPRSVQIVPFPDEDSAFVVVQQAGKLMTVRRVNNAWAKTDSATFTVVNGTSGASEEGLLGMTFHPNFRQNRKYYAYYIAPRSGGGYAQVVERMTDSTFRPHTGDAQRTLLKLSDPYNNHNGGTLAFGPTDGYLYFALGDGGSGGDPQGRAQNLDSLFGKFMRLDVDGTDAFPADTTKNYAIPGDNPFFGQAGKRPEIWAYGVRNPFRWTFHPITHEIWVGDVGQEYQEEVSHVTKGANMGWKIREGNSCYNGQPLTSCDGTGMTPAVITIPRSQGQSITGGQFFIGNPSSAFHGVYFFGDYASDSLWAARIVNDSVTERIRIGSLNAVASFNLDRQGRILALSVLDGTVNVLESPDMVLASVSLRSGRQGGLKASPISLAELRREPESYTVTGLDGRATRLLSTPRGTVNGTFLVQKKGSSVPAQLMLVVW